MNLKMPSFPLITQIYEFCQAVIGVVLSSTKPMPIVVGTAETKKAANAAFLPKPTLAD
jgi:hypothetical protein